MTGQGRSWQQDGGKAMTSADREKRRYHKQREAARRPRRRVGRLITRYSYDRPFVAVDGEGCGIDDIGRQNYMLLRAGRSELFTGKPLRTWECLDFLCKLPPDAIYVGFSFGYDVTMICRDLVSDKRERLLRPKVYEKGISPYTYYRDFAIEYLPKNYFRVCRVRWTAEGKPERVEGSVRTVYETFGFFQKSFLRSITEFSIGSPEERASIAADKANRAYVAEITDHERAYCALECRLLAELMERLRTVCLGAGLRPRTWNGAGKLATALHSEHDTPKAKQLAELIPPEVRALAQTAYYGGRFEVTRVGYLEGPIYEYDIRSAYPAAMGRLPCLLHGRWFPASPAQLARAAKGTLWIAPVKFRHDPPASVKVANLYGLPIRQKNGSLFWPAEGQGVYWSVEVEAARGLGCKPAVRAGWRYECECDCKPFSWVEELYEKRRELGAQLEGYPIKLGLNSLYGKLAQRIGSATYGNPVWAGLITAMTRAALIDAAAEDQEAICMLATDAVLSLRPLRLVLGESLGQWEAKRHASVFIVQPGLYWGPPPGADEKRSLKTRGAPMSFFAQHTGRFEKRWIAYARRAQRGEAVKAPIVKLRINLFVGLKLAQARGKPATAGMWVRKPKGFSFRWNDGKFHKRARGVWETALSVRTYPRQGSPDLVSLPHKGDMALIEALDLSKEELEEQPDYIELSAPFME